MMRGFRLLFIFVLMVSSVILVRPQFVAAAEYDIKEMTPEVKSALDSRRARFDQVRAYKEKGAIGENNLGYLELLSEDVEAQALVKAENKDRRQIYQAILEQNNLPAGELDKVEKAFAQVQRDKAAPGDKIQDPEGQWITK